MVDLLLMARQSCQGLLGVLGGERGPEEQGVVVRAGDHQLRGDGGELLVAGEGERLGCGRRRRSARGERGRRRRGEGSPSASSAGCLAFWSKGPVRRIKSVFRAMVLTQ